MHSIIPTESWVSIRYYKALVAYRKGLSSNPTGAGEFLVYIFYFKIKSDRPIIILSITLTFRRCGGDGITFLWFLRFLMCVAVNIRPCINCFLGRPTYVSSRAALVFAAVFLRKL